MAIEFRPKPQATKKPAAPKTAGPIKASTKIKTGDEPSQKIVPAEEVLTNPNIPVGASIVERDGKFHALEDRGSKAGRPILLGIYDKYTEALSRVMELPAKAKKAPEPKPAAQKPADKPALGKKLQSMRLDIEVVDAFKAQGKGWQGKINAALRQHLGL